MRATTANPRGLAYQLPPQEMIGPPEIRKAAKEYATLQAERSAAARAVGEAEDQLRRAAPEDAEAYAVARRAGKRDPGPVAETKARAALAEARRILAGAERALEQSGVDLERVVAQHKATWASEIEERVETAATELEERIADLEQARLSLREARTLQVWLGRFPGIKAFTVGQPSPGLIEELKAEARPRVSPFPDQLNVAGEGEQAPELEPAS